MNGVDDSIYMYSVNTNAGDMTLYVNFEVGTDPNIDQVLVADALLAGRVAAARGRAQLRRHDPEVDHEPARALLALLAERDLRRRVPRQLRLHQRLRPDGARARASGRSRCSAPASTRCASGCGPTCWRSAASPCPRSSRAIQRAEHGEPGRPGRRRAGAARARSSPTRCAPRAASSARRSSATSSCARRPTAR